MYTEAAALANFTGLNLIKVPTLATALGWLILVWLALALVGVALALESAVVVAESAMIVEWW